MRSALSLALSLSLALALALSLSLSLSLSASAQDALPAGWSRVARVVNGTPTAAACSRDTAFVREWSGTVVSFDGTRGTQLPRLTQSAYGRAIAVDDANHPMISTSTGIVVYDGSDWVLRDTGGVDAGSGLFVLDASHAYFVRPGTIGVSEGGAFSLFSIGTWREFDAIAGRSPSDLWAVGQGGTVMHWDGHAWARETTNSDAWLHGVALGAHDVWAWSDQVILHRDASGWPPSAMGSPVGALEAIVVRGEQVFAVGYTGVARWTNGAWSPELPATATGSYASFGPACATDRSLVVVLSSGDVLVRAL